MNRGKKLSDPQRKKLAGTFKQSVDGATATFAPVDRDIPLQPAWLSEAAKTVWSDMLESVVATGSTSVDSASFALLCETMAVFIASVKAGEPANAAFRSELRKQMELAGIAGAKSRLAKMAAPEAAKASSPFTIRK
jgi:phage terminase small subunit